MVEMTELANSASFSVSDSWIGQGSKCGHFADGRVHSLQSGNEHFHGYLAALPLLIWSPGLWFLTVCFHHSHGAVAQEKIPDTLAPYNVTQPSENWADTDTYTSHGCEHFFLAQ